MRAAEREKIRGRLQALEACRDRSLACGGRRQLAARHLFSTLSHLEELAVIAAERGDGIPGQLEDELVHRAAFAAEANALGGMLSPTPECQALVSYVCRLHGPLSLAVLNVVAEGWLGNAFEHLARAGFSPALLEAVGKDEERHTHEALALAKPTPEEAAEPLAELEAHLARFASSPGWLLPLHELIGSQGCAEMGLGGVAAHRLACAHLGVRPEDGARAIEVSCRTARAYPEGAPESVPMTAWQVSKARLWREPAPIYDGRWVEAPAEAADRVEALVVQAVGATLDYRPGLRRTIRAGELFRPRGVVVGVRRLHDRQTRAVVTVYARSPHHRTLEVLEAELARRVTRIREQPYEAVPVLGDLEALLPAPACAVVVSQCAPWSVREGFAALVPLEGVAALVVIGAPVDGRVHLGVTADHRVWDAYEVGRFLDGVEGALRRGPGAAE